MIHCVWGCFPSCECAKTPTDTHKDLNTLSYHTTGLDNALSDMAYSEGERDISHSLFFTYWENRVPYISSTVVRWIFRHWPESWPWLHLHHLPAPSPTAPLTDLRGLPSYQAHLIKKCMNLPESPGERERGKVEEAKYRMIKQNRRK